MPAVEILRFFLQTGWVAKIVLATLVVFSLASWSVILAKWRELGAAGRASDRFIRIFREASRLNEAAATATKHRASPLAGMFQAGYTELEAQIRSQRREGEAGATLIAHETATRLRLRLPADADLDALHDALLALPGVTSLRRVGAARSLVIAYDGRAGTRREVLAHAERIASAPAQPRRPQPSSAGLPLEAALAAGALVPLLPPQLRPAAAALLVSAKTVGALRSGAEPGGAVVINASGDDALAHPCLHTHRVQR